MDLIEQEEVAGQLVGSLLAAIDALRGHASERVTHAAMQDLCDALDAAGYRPTGWKEPERLK